MKYLALLAVSANAVPLLQTTLIKNWAANSTSTCQTKPGQDCFGSDIRNEGSASPEDCCNRCQVTGGCAAFTWNQYDGRGQYNPTCYLKSGCSSTQSCPSCTAGTTSGPASPTPAASPTPVPSHKDYCPLASDLTVAYGSPQLMDGGWVIRAGGGAASKAAFNLLGGSVEFDLDLSGVPAGVNANIYTISPKVTGGAFSSGDYCDGAENDKPWCTEVDWLESNGNCGGATTLHTIPGPGMGCTAWGCRVDYHYNGRTTFHMRVEYGQDGQWTTIRDGQVISPSSLQPPAVPSDWAELKSQYASLGAVIYSSQWVGWVPVDDCGTNPGDLNKAVFTVKNLKISGTVVQGPEPNHC